MKKKKGLLMIFGAAVLGGIVYIGYKLGLTSPAENNVVSAPTATATITQPTPTRVRTGKD